MTTKESTTQQTVQSGYVASKEIQERTFKLLEQRIDKHINVLKRLKDK